VSSRMHFRTASHAGVPRRAVGVIAAAGNLAGCVRQSIRGIPIHEGKCGHSTRLGNCRSGFRIKWCEQVLWLRRGCASKAWVQLASIRIPVCSFVLLTKKAAEAFLEIQPCFAGGRSTNSLSGQRIRRKSPPPSPKLKKSLPSEGII